MNNQDFGNFISTLRKEKGLTQKELGEKLNITDKAVSRWENGKNYPDIEMLGTLAEELGVSINELLACKKSQTQKEAEMETAKAYLGNVKAVKLSRKLAAVVLSVLILFVSMLIFYAVYGVENTAYIVSDIVVNDKIMSLGVSSPNKITGLKTTEADGDVILRVRVSPLIKSDGEEKIVRFSAEDYINKIEATDGTVFWECDEIISKRINDIFDAKVKYICDNSAVSKLLRATDFSNELMCEDYKIELVTDKKPYGLVITDMVLKNDIFTTVSSRTYEQKIKTYAFLLLACIENADYIRFEYTLPDGNEETFELTTEEANTCSYIVQGSESVKNFAESHHSLKVLIDTVGGQISFSDDFRYKAVFDDTSAETLNMLNNNPIDSKYSEIRTNTQYFDILQEEKNYINWAKAYEKQYNYLYDELLSFAKTSENVEDYARENLIEVIKNIKDYSQYSERFAGLFTETGYAVMGTGSMYQYEYCKIYMYEMRNCALRLAELAYFMGVDFDWLV